HTFSPPFPSTPLFRSSSKRPATRATIYRTKGRFDLTLPRHSGVLSGVLRHSPPHGGALRVVKVPAFSKSTVRVRTASVDDPNQTDRKSTRLNSSHDQI